MSEDTQLVIRYDRLPPEWRMNNVGLEATRTMQAAIAATGTHGIYSGIPIICKGKNCPFIDTCAMDAMDVDTDGLIGQRCPVEIAEILDLYEKYTNQFGINEDQEDMVLIGLVKELIDYEIQIRRADHRMAASGDFLEDVVVGISDGGQPIINKQIAKPIDYKERAIKKKHEILDLLNSTPKNKASKFGAGTDPSNYASSLFERAQRLEVIDVIEATEVKEEEPKKPKKKKK